MQLYFSKKNTIDSLPPLSKELLAQLQTSSSSESKSTEGADFWVDYNEKQRKKNEKEELEKQKEKKRFIVESPNLSPKGK